MELEWQAHLIKDNKFVIYVDHDGVKRPLASIEFNPVAALGAVELEHLLRGASDLLAACEAQPNKIKRAMELYSVAGDDINTPEEYYDFTRQARALLVEVMNDLGNAIAKATGTS